MAYALSLPRAGGGLAAPPSRDATVVPRVKSCTLAFSRVREKVAKPDEGITCS